MGLLLRPDAYYAPTPDGAYVLTHDGEVNLVGRSVYQVIERLTPLLDGTYSLAELTAGLSEDRQAMVRDLVTRLLECSIVRDVEPGGALDAGPPGHSHEIAFTGYFRDSPATVFGAYQSMVTLVIGAGRLCGAVVAAAVRSGLRDVRVLTTAECPTHLEGPGAAGCGWREERSRLDPGLPRREAEDAIRSTLDGVDLVLHASDLPMTERARVLDRVCGELGVRLAQALPLGDHAWLMTTGTGGREAVGWTSGRRRHLARRPETMERPPGEDTPANVTPSATSARLVAGQLVHGVFLSLTQPARPEGPRMVRVDASSLAGEVCAFLPHPFEDRPAPGAGTVDFSDRIAALRGGARLEEELFSRRAVLCAGDQTGIFGIPAEDRFAQVPLHVCAVEVSDPVGLLNGGPVPRVIGAGPDFATARYQAALRAFACYSSLMIDPRRLRTGEDGPITRCTDPDEMLSALRSGELTGFVRGYGPVDGTVHLVDVARVFPALHAPACPYVPPAGVAAAYDWDEAVVSGMLDQCLRLTLGDATASATPFPRVDFAGAALDARGERYRALLAAIGDPVTVFDITGAIGVPTVVCYLGSVPAGRASSLSAAGAVTDALEQVLLHHQSRHNGQPDYAPPPVRGIPRHLRGDTVGALSGVALRDGADLADALVKQGHRPVAVPLDHDPEVSALMPYVVRVVIDDA